jgi:hypothetical protein
VAEKPDQQTEPAPSEPPFPLVVLIAGIAEILIGTLLLISAFLSLWLLGSPVGIKAGMQWLGVALGSIAMIGIGTNMLRGKHTGIFFPAVGWLLFGLGFMTLGRLFLFVIGGTASEEITWAKPTRDPWDKLAAMLMGTSLLLVGLAFSGVGVLLLRARNRYQAWRQWDQRRRF